MGGLELWWSDETWHTDRIDHVDAACKVSSLVHDAIGIQTHLGITEKVFCICGKNEKSQGVNNIRHS